MILFVDLWIFVVVVVVVVFHEVFLVVLVETLPALFEVVGRLVVSVTPLL